MSTEVGEDIVGLGVSEAEFEMWYPGKAPGSTMFTRELRGEPELEDLGLVFEPLMIFAVVGGCEARYVHAPMFMVLANVLGKESPSLGDLKGLVGGLFLRLLFVSQLVPDERVSTLIGRRIQ